MIGRRRLSGLILAAALAAGIVHSPSKAEEPKKFEATLAVPGLVVAEEGPNLADCPEPGDLDGTFYKFFDLEGDFTVYKAVGPTHLFNEPNPVGIHDINDYDIDMYAFDAKCNEITPSSANGPSGLERFETKKPGRYVVVTYWSGIHPELPITLEVANSKIP